MSDLHEGDSGEGRREDCSPAVSEEALARKRAALSKPVPAKPSFLIRFVEGRVFEWVMTLSLILTGIQTLAFHDTISRSAFKYLMLVTTENQIGLGLLMLGWVRLSALMLNGQTIRGYKAGPFFRAIGSVAASVVWAQFVIALLQLSVTQGYPSPGISFWFMATFGEIYVAYQTVKNA